MCRSYLKRALALCLLTTGCALEVDKAQAPTRPPVVEQKQFKLSLVEGAYQQLSAPNMFLWPIYGVNEEGEEILLSAKEQREKRALISGYSEQKFYFETLWKEAAYAVEVKYSGLQQDSEATFKANACYALCDPESIFCDPEDSDVIFVDDWKVAETPEEQALLTLCQENQRSRESLEEDKEAEKEVSVYPLRDKAAEASKNLLITIGEKNYFPEMLSISFRYGALSCDYLEGCKTGEGQNLFVEVEYGAFELNNYANNPLTLKIYDVELDSINGFMTFKMPALKTEGDALLAYGEIEFDLELTSLPEGLRVDGDIHVREFFGGEERVGRFFSLGVVEPISL